MHTLVSKLVALSVQKYYMALKQRLACALTHLQLVHTIVDQGSVVTITAQRLKLVLKRPFLAMSLILMFRVNNSLMLTYVYAMFQALWCDCCWS